MGKIAGAEGTCSVTITFFGLSAVHAKASNLDRAVVTTGSIFVPNSAIATQRGDSIHQLDVKISTYPRVTRSRMVNGGREWRAFDRLFERGLLVGQSITSLEEALPRAIGEHGLPVAYPLS